MHAKKKKTISQRAPLPPANPCMFNMRQIIWKWYANIYLFWWLRVRTARVGVFKCGERKKKLHFKKFNHLPWGWCLNKTHSERWLQRVHSCSINIVETIMHLLYIKKKNSQNKALAKTLVSEKLFQGKLKVLWSESITTNSNISAPHFPSSVALRTLTQRNIVYQNRSHRLKGIAYYNQGLPSMLIHWNSIPN